MTEDEFDDILRDVQAVITGGIDDCQTSEEILNTVRRAMEPMTETSRGDYKRLADEYQAGLDWMRAIEYAANIASIHAHHALWNGLLPYGWDEAIEQFGRNLANAIAKAIKAEVPKRLAAEPVKAGEPVAWLHRHPSFGRDLQFASLTDADKSYGWTECPLYLAPPASDVLREALEAIVAIVNREFGEDWEEIEEAREIARNALAQAANQSDGGDLLSTRRLDDLGSVQDGRKMSTDGQPRVGLSTTSVERETGANCVTGGESAATPHATQARDAITRLLDQFERDGEIGIAKLAMLRSAVGVIGQRSPAPHEVAVADIAAERKRQRDVEGWTSDHDDDHDRGELAQAAAAYAFYDTDAENGQPSAESLFPTTWSSSWWKPKDRRSNLVRAGALIVAEIERLDRLNAFNIGRR